MPKTYSYDPTQINGGGKDQMRFELGDTAVEGAEETCALCDEEYTAIIDKNIADGRSFGFSKYKCLDAIMMKFSFEVDYSAGGMSLSLSQRYDRWRQLWLQMQKQHQTIEANPAALGDNKADGGHYFHLGQNDNWRIASPMFPYRKM